MKIINQLSKASLTATLLLLINSCGTVYDVVFVNAGPSSSNQTINTSYSPDGESIVPFKVSTASIQLNESTNASIPFGGESQDAILGYFVGIGANIPLKDNLSARTEFRFSKRGSKTDINNIASNTTRLSYIDVPFELQYRFSPKWTVQGGLQPSLLLAANMKSEVNEESFDRSVKDNYKGFDVAATLGLGYDITNNVKVSLGYDLGLLNIEKQADFREVGNRSIRLGLQYTIKRW